MSSFLKRLTSLLERLFEAALPIWAALLALAVGAMVLFLLGVNPFRAYLAMIQGAFGSFNAFAETLVKATPLLLIGIGICIAYRGNVINIGGEGQMIVGAILATWFGLTFVNWPGWLVIPLALLLGMLGGAIWGGIPGVLKAYFNVNEILSTVMMNGIAVQLMNFLLRGPMIDPAQALQASKIPQ
ncbi:MAG: ABC transporter permease, partial [Anaerolineales bacterium]